jgi:proline iminopeptidase
MTYMQIRDVSLFVKVMGQGYPLVLMHGGPSLDHTTLLPLQPLADQFTLIYYDHRCNGRSAGIDASSMTMENLTADADALRQELGFDRWAVLGHSFGGQVALEYALRYPQSLTHLVLMNTGGDQWWVNHNASQLLAKRGFDAVAVNAAHRFYNGEVTVDEYIPFLMKFIKAYSYHSSLLYQPSIITLALKLGLNPPMKLQPEALIFGYGQMLQGWTVMDRLKEIKTPTLVMAGRYDFLFPPEHQAILADRIPNACLELIECAGHNPQIEQKDVTIQIIRSFLSNQKPDYATQALSANAA